MPRLNYNCGSPKEPVKKMYYPAPDQPNQLYNFSNSLPNIDLIDNSCPSPGVFPLPTGASQLYSVSAQSNSERISDDELAKLQKDFILNCSTSKLTSLKKNPNRIYSPARKMDYINNTARNNDEISKYKRQRSNWYRESENNRGFRKCWKGSCHKIYRNRTTNNRSNSFNKEDLQMAAHSFEESRSVLLSKKKLFINKWRLNNCSMITTMNYNLKEPENILKKEIQFSTKAFLADLYYKKNDDIRVVVATKQLLATCLQFEKTLLDRGTIARSKQPLKSIPRMKLDKPKIYNDTSESSSEWEDCELLNEFKDEREHPNRLHPELWFNEPGELNFGPVCHCSANSKCIGIIHNIYVGEVKLLKCDTDTNNADKLFHYRITFSPVTNLLINTPTVIQHDNHEFVFEGFSMFSHKPLENLPLSKVVRYNIEYTILCIEDTQPHYFTIRELDLFHEFLFKEILELVDWDFKAAGDVDSCSLFHFMPRFVRELPDNRKELLSMNYILSYLLQSSVPLIPKEQLSEVINAPHMRRILLDEVKGMVVTYPGKKPCSIRIDQLDYDRCKTGDQINFPEIVHFGLKPVQLAYVKNPEYQKTHKEYVKFRRFLAKMPKCSYDNKRKLEVLENNLKKIKNQSNMKRFSTATVSSDGFYRTGIMCDIVQHALFLPVLVTHLRFHGSLEELERNINYKFKNRSLLQVALTHASYTDNCGTNPDHIRNSLSNCGIRQPEYGDKKKKTYMNSRRITINIMSSFGKNSETESNVFHNERLEFLGDAVVGFLSTIHLFHLFPRLEEGGLSTYKTAIAENQYLAVLASKLRLDEYMLHSHSRDFSHYIDLKHAMANCFEALIGALFLDGGIETADEVFGNALFDDSKILLTVWKNYPPHPLQKEEPRGDRHYIPKHNLLKKLTEFEDLIGVQFKHIRLLGRAFTGCSFGFNNLTLGSNERLEFLGDAVLQLVVTEYLYKHFPDHREGHMTLLRSSLVCNQTLAVVCDDLGMPAFSRRFSKKSVLSIKNKADLSEAFIGALYVDKGLDYCKTFCNVCIFPRLQSFIMNQDWNDPKSKLQQYCLVCGTIYGKSPEAPIYKVIGSKGPSQLRVFTVAVYLKGKRLATSSGYTIQQAEMNAAQKALDNSHNIFPENRQQCMDKKIRGEYSGSQSEHYSSSDERMCSFSKPNHSRRRRLPLSYSRGIRSTSSSSVSSGSQENKKSKSYSDSSSDSSTDGSESPGRLSYEGFHNKNKCSSNFKQVPKTNTTLSDQALNTGGPCCSTYNTEK